MTPPTPHSPCLVGDVGGTHARFALTQGEHLPLQHLRTLPTARYAHLAEALAAYLQDIGQPVVRRACVAIANPITGDWLKMTNTPWSFSIAQTRQQLGLDELRMLNDWEAMALAAPTFTAEDLVQIGPGQALVGAPCGLLGPGTGLGVSSLVRSASGEWVPMAGEGGHVTLAPTCAREADILGVLWREHAHVSAERVISGMGLENLYRAIALLNGKPVQAWRAADITQKALERQDRACEEALACMCRLLGNVAGNLALTLGARGGIFIGGGVIKHLGPYLAASGFRAAFEAKGRFDTYLRQIPTFVIQAEQPALRGAAMGLGLSVRT